MNTTEIKIIDWVKVEAAKLTKEIPAVVKLYGNEGLSVCNQIKALLASPTVQLIEVGVQVLIPGTWEATVIAAITKAVGIAIPMLTELVANSGESLDSQAVAFVQYLQTLSPKLRNAAIMKFLSCIFMALDPSLIEVEADDAAQLAYSISVKKAA